MDIFRGSPCNLWRQFLILYNFTYYIPRWKLQLVCHQSPKRGRLEVHLVPPLVGFGVLMTNLVEGLMCLWELQDNTGRSPSLIRFSYQRWPLKMYEDIDVKGGIWRYSHWRLWQEKTSHEAYGARRLRSFVVLFLLCWDIGTTALLSEVQVSKVRVTEVMLNQILCLRAKTMRANLIQSWMSQLYL